MCIYKAQVANYKVLALFFFQGSLLAKHKLPKLQAEQLRRRGRPIVQCNISPWYMQRKNAQVE